MSKEEIYEKVRCIIKSPKFEARLEGINKNYPNIKQEIPIRNLLLEMINEDFFAHSFDYRAFAEFYHPDNSKKRVDLTLVRKGHSEERYLIELKYQFSNDYLRFDKYDQVVQNDFEVRKSDLFILIVAHWNKEETKKFQEEWNPTPNLNKFIATKDCWKTNIPNLLNTYGDCSEPISYTAEEYHSTDYNFYLLRRPESTFETRHEIQDNKLLKKETVNT